MMEDLKKAYQKKVQESHAETIAACKKDIEYGKNAATAAAVKGDASAFFFLEPKSNPEVVAKHFMGLGFKAETTALMVDGPNKGQVKVTLSGWSE